MANLDGTIRRTDLNFRGVHFDLKTTIYRLKEYEYVICCDNFQGDFKQLKEEFYHNFRQIGCPVSLVDEIPLHYEAIISAIDDKDIPLNFAGIFTNSHYLLDMLFSKFPKFPIYKVESAHHKIRVHLNYPNKKTDMGIQYSYMPIRDRNALNAFLSGLEMTVDFEVVEDHLDSVELPEAPLVVNPVQELFSNRLRTKETNGFSERDDSLWFDNAADIYKGSFNKNKLYFINDQDYCCYADFSTFGNINIRNFLLLYETVYITPPFEKALKDWLSEQQIKIEHFGELILNGRIRLLLPQPETRYDLGFIKECYQINPSSVITRRALATLQLYDIVQMADNYLLQDPALLSQIPAYCEAVAEKLGWDTGSYYDLLIWPLKAKRQAFEALHFNGVYSTASLGINQVIEKWVSKQNNRDLGFEFSVSAENIHLSHALNATYFPFAGKMGKVDAACANIMGNFLNQVKLSTMDQLNAGIKGITRRESVVPINPIDIFKLNDFDDLNFFENEVKNSAAFPKGKHLMEYLAGLSEADREKKILGYNAAVEKSVRKHNGQAFAMDLGTNVVLDTIGIATGYPFLGTGWSMLKKGGQNLAKVLPKIKSIEEKLEEAFHQNPDKANIHFLTQINRVAKLKDA